MTPDQYDLLRMAVASLNAAEVLLNNGYAGFAASRAYYAMFYIAEAFLEGEGLSFSKHSAVIAAFGQHFARPQKVPPEFHRFLLEAQSARQAGDYGDLDAVSPEKAYILIAQTREFLKVAEALIGPIPDEGED